MDNAKRPDTGLTEEELQQLLADLPNIIKKLEIWQYEAKHLKHST
ncbi:hypothetical protein [Sporomusa termitida]|nr:hypothetical protein [Sporomusa termitida]